MVVAVWAIVACDIEFGVGGAKGIQITIVTALQASSNLLDSKKNLLGPASVGGTEMLPRIPIIIFSLASVVFCDLTEI